MVLKCGTDLFLSFFFQPKMLGMLFVGVLLGVFYQQKGGLQQKGGPTGMGGDFQSSGISPALWGQADGYNPAPSPTLHNRKSHLGKGPNVKPPVIPRYCRDN